jgi:thiopeptide-type bacteriocin biosynthesis protein
VLDNLILAEASWNVQAVHVKPIVDAFKKGDMRTMQGEVAAWRTRYQIPRYICLVDSDNELYVDLENQWLTETFLDEIKSRNAFRIKEFLFRSENATVHSEKGWHTNQFVVAFKNEPEKKASFPVRPAVPSLQQPSTRKFISGSEWLYYKIYTGIKTADRLLTEVLYPLTERFKAKGWIDKFFFIRYSDPNLHFRIRFHFTHTKHVGSVIGELHKKLLPYLENKSITAVVNDTYNRELERYGRTSIDWVEEYFHVDSRTILHFLSLIEGAEGEECRWRFGMKMLDDLLTAFGFDLKGKLDFVDGNTEHFGKEFGYNQSLKKQLDARYKEIEGAMRELFAESNEEHQFFYELCRQRGDELREFAGNIAQMAALGTLQVPLEGLLSSLIHMNVNRLFRSRQRFVEYSLYYHLSKYYRIQYGRTVLARKATPSAPALA